MSEQISSDPAKANGEQPFAGARGSATGGSWLRLAAEAARAHMHSGREAIESGGAGACPICLAQRVQRLEAAIKETLEENAHLADGETCTLIKLKRALTPNKQLSDS